MQQDQFQRLLPTFIQVIELTEWEETEYWGVVSAVFEGKTPPPDLESKPTTPAVSKSTSALNSDLLDIGISNKVSLTTISFIYVKEDEYSFHWYKC